MILILRIFYASGTDYSKKCFKNNEFKDGLSKMSKSDPSDSSRINLKDNNDQISQKIKKAKTDNEAINLNILDKNSKKRYEAKNLISIYASLKDVEIKKCY